jgi:hypothetical protein
MLVFSILQILGPRTIPRSRIRDAFPFCLHYISDEAKAPLEVVLSHIRKIVDAEATDEQLVERFAHGHEEPAFATLLRRHGPMVLGVSQGILRQLQDAEDVFQATFLLLARKAGSGSRKKLRPPWSDWPSDPNSPAKKPPFRG